ncbi:MAG: FtsB family cell division protein [Hyphomicrobiales bacterium]
MVRRKFDLVVTVVCLALLGYFGWHAFKGPRGFAHEEGLEAQAKKLALELEGLRAGRKGLDRRVALMRPESIDPDMLDELSRSELGYVKAGDLVIVTAR